MIKDTIKNNIKSFNRKLTYDDIIILSVELASSYEDAIFIIKSYYNIDDEEVNKLLKYRQPNPYAVVDNIVEKEARKLGLY